MKVLDGVHAKLGAVILGFGLVTSSAYASESGAVLILREALLGAGTGAIAAEASGGKPGKGALIGAGTNVIGSALLSLLTESSGKSHYAPSHQSRYQSHPTYYSQPVYNQPVYYTQSSHSQHRYQDHRDDRWRDNRHDNRYERRYKNKHKRYNTPDRVVKTYRTTTTQETVVEEFWY